MWDWTSWLSCHFKFMSIFIRYECVFIPESVKEICISALVLCDHSIWWLFLTDVWHLTTATCWGQNEPVQGRTRVLSTSALASHFTVCKTYSDQYDVHIFVVKLCHTSSGWKCIHSFYLELKVMLCQNPHWSTHTHTKLLWRDNLNHIQWVN